MSFLMTVHKITVRCVVWMSFLVSCSLTEYLHSYLSLLFSTNITHLHTLTHSH
eukprot:m.170360 g.170360  ORF g.170360 m.170360 type:complete len:53 (+) comp14528_c0_seq4:172-330(+)